MKYTSEIDIDLPRTRVIELFDNADNLAKWQEGFVSFETISGKPGEEGAKAKMEYKMGKREIKMIETITKRNLPNEFNGTYEAKGVFNIIENRFIDNGDSTKWISVNEFQFKGFMKLFAIFMPGAFKKQTLKYMKDFKKFAEGE
jgi:hypothetical protein